MGRKRLSPYDAAAFWLEREQRLRDRALFDLAIDSKLRGCDLVRVRIGDLVSGGRVRNRALMIQQKTGRPVQFELLEPARSTILIWLERRGGSAEDYAFPSRLDHSEHISTRQYARLVDEWVTALVLRREDYGTHFSPENEGRHHLQADRQPSYCSDSAGTYEDRDHRSLPGSRGRGCPGIS